MSTPITDLVAHAARVEGHVTLHANYTPTSTRHPEPDWSAQVIWIVTDQQTGQSEPASIYGTGATLAEACATALALLTVEEDTP